MQPFSVDLSKVKISKGPGVGTRHLAHKPLVEVLRWCWWHSLVDHGQAEPTDSKPIRSRWGGWNFQLCKGLHCFCHVIRAEALPEAGNPLSL